MGTKYSSNSISGYNATPPADDGTVSEANKVKWSTVKTKLSDPVKTLAETINTELATHFDNGPTALSTNTTLGATHYNQVIEASGASVTLTLTDAGTLTAGWFCEIRVVGAANITLARATAGDTLNGVASNYTLVPGFSGKIVVNAAADGFLVLNESINRGNDGGVMRIKAGGEGQETWIPHDHIAGLEITIGTDTDHDLDIAIGECSSSANAYVITLAAAVTRQLDVAYATGNGGLSSSLSPANSTVYYVHAIINSSGTHDIAFDTSATAANLVTDHSITAYRQIGTFTTDGSANIDSTTLSYVDLIEGQRIKDGTIPFDKLDSTDGEVWVNIATSTISADATVDTFFDPSLYRRVRFRFIDVDLNADGGFYARYSSDGATFVTAANYNNSGATFWAIGTGIEGSSQRSLIFGDFVVDNPNATGYPHVKWDFMSIDSTSQQPQAHDGQGYYNSGSGNCQGIRFAPSTATAFSTGTIIAEGLLP